MGTGSDSSSKSSTGSSDPPMSESSRRLSYWKVVFSDSLFNQAVLDYDYNGNGTEDDPFVVEFIPHDIRDPMEFPTWMRWTITMVAAVTTLAVAFASSCFTGGVKEMVEGFQTSDEVITLGVSLFVLGVN